MIRLSTGAALGVAVAAAVATPLSAASAAPAAAPSQAPGLTTASASADRDHSALGLSSDELLVLRNVITDRDGTQHVRYDRTYKGLRVVGGDLVVEKARSGSMRDVRWNGNGKVAVASTSPTVAEASAEKSGAKRAGYAPRRNDGELVVWAGDKLLLDGASLVLERGEHVALVGHNGSGKTTLLKMAAGLLDPSGGSVSIAGHESGSEGARRAMSWLSDNPTFYDDLSLWEHLEYVARLHGVDDWEPVAESLVERLGLGERRDQIPTTFSRGLRQKAAITLACVRPFDVLLVDEPFIGLDETGKRALMALFDEAAERGATLLIATHELSFVDKVGRLLALRDGQLTYDGPPTGIDVRALVMPS